MDFSEKWGKDVDEAVRLALIDLRCDESEVDITVIEEPTKGFLGLGAKLAKVRVEKKNEKTQVKADKKIVKNDVKKDIKSDPITKTEGQVEDSVKVEEVKAVAVEETVAIEVLSEVRDTKTDSKFSIKERPADLEEITDHVALEFLKEIIEKMGLDLTLKAFKNESHIYVEMEGKDSGTIIGKRGQTLDSIQYLTSLVVNKNKEKYVRVVVDAENYRLKREQTLEQLANRLADKVVKSGRSVRLEPMNPYERKVIHATLQQNPKVTTKSEGEEPFRRVVVDLK